ncbi:MAG: DUF2884 family protein [Lysobacterales bacterium]
MYRTLTLALAAALMAPLSQAMAEVHLNARCEIDSAYDLTVETDALRFQRNGGPAIEFADGRVRIDGVEQTISAGDRDRVVQFEQEVRRLLPEVRQIAGEAVEIAFTALQGVITSFSSEANRGEFERELSALRAEIDRAIASAHSTRIIEDQLFEQRVEEFATRLAPRLAGEFAAAAVSAALSGDEARASEIEQRAEQLSREVEASVEAPAKALEARVNALCPRVQALDQIDDALELRLPDGKPLQLFEVDQEA